MKQLSENGSVSFAIISSWLYQFIRQENWAENTRSRRERSSWRLGLQVLRSCARPARRSRALREARYSSTSFIYRLFNECVILFVVCIYCKEFWIVFIRLRACLRLLLLLPEAPPPKKSRGELAREADPFYYGFRDDEDQTLVPIEREAEQKGTLRFDPVINNILRNIVHVYVKWKPYPADIVITFITDF